LNRRFHFHKRSQLFIRAHNETLSAALRINNENRTKASASPSASPAKK
jgi:hypothetical protein